MEIHQLEAFLAIVDEQGFSLAARRLHLSRPAISQRIAALESSLGAPVFERVRPVRLTITGRLLEPHARRILLDVDTALNVLRSPSSPSIARLPMGLTASTPSSRGHFRSSEISRAQ